MFRHPRSIDNLRGNHCWTLDDPDTEHLRRVSAGQTLAGIPKYVQSIIELNLISELRLLTQIL